MKKIIEKTAVILSIAAVSLSTLISCASLPDFSEKQIKKFQDAKGSPNDSVVFYGFLPMNNIVKFKQIDKKYSNDEQDGIKLSFNDASGFWLSTPVEPGSTYMISYIQGSVQGGTTSSTVTTAFGSATTITFHDYVWDQSFSEEQQYFVIKIPQKPGFYCFGQYTGREIMVAAQAGKPTKIFDQENIKEKWGKNANQIMVNGLKQIIKAYKGTEWENAALKELNKYSAK
ncbi:hypothetical protein HRI96_07815 [Treponema parvum]|uniref:Lipoprotein n=1 Tax=Treponema parvum TaxID=138851 RepID=A0A975ICL0_9SPIR|nr:hypothetical protein [Treponema parvum]QTQ12106.1 hypothetical protein HRI96_07815 [Treponema parvum]